MGRAEWTLVLLIISIFALTAIFASNALEFVGGIWIIAIVAIIYLVLTRPKKKGNKS